MYKHIVFDVDGTLINTEYAVLHSLKDVLLEVTGKNYDVADLTFALGITGETTLKRLNIANVAFVNDLWNKYLDKYRDKVCVFDGIKELLNKLKPFYGIGIVTSKTTTEFKNDFSYFGLDEYFNIIICADDTEKHKPNPEPLLKYMELSKTNNDDILYIGDSTYDMQCANSANVKFAFAKWGNKYQTLNADFVLEKPSDLLFFSLSSFCLSSFFCFS